MIEILQEKIVNLKESEGLNSNEFRNGNTLYLQGYCQVLSQSSSYYEILINHNEQEMVATIQLEGDHLIYRVNDKESQWDRYAVAALLQALEDCEQSQPHEISEGRAYTREGMMLRVLKERREKAHKADYRITFAQNVHGEHLVKTETGKTYKITLRDFEKETGYIDNPDLKTNKLGTTKHIMFAYQALRAQPKLMESLDQHYPFVEIFLDPQNEYRITWHYPHTMPDEIGSLIQETFGEGQTISDDAVKDFLSFIQQAEDHDLILVRPEVVDKVEKAWDKEVIEKVRKETTIDFSLLNLQPFPYQQEGIRFATYRSGAIIADEMGLGKTIQAIGTALMKKHFFDFKKTLIVCPASLKHQWKKEIEKFCGESAVIAEGMPELRAEIYKNDPAYFVIVNYETVLRDINEINRMAPDFVILDEAQKIKNFATITARTIKQIKRKHALVITGTPIENRLIDIYSLVDFVEPGFLAPLWEFSYQHCYFDVKTQSKITGYFDLQLLNERLKPILIRREKRKVINDLPNVTEMMVPVPLSIEQAGYHSDFGMGVAAILRKKYKTPFDFQRLMLLLNSMRMACDSTFLIDKETNVSPKLEELKYILLDKLDIVNEDRKVIIFSEWVTMLHLISQMLKEIGVGHVMLSGKVAVKNRSKLVKKFEEDKRCKVFLSSEAGGAGLNLQVADTVINFELPWNPAKKNQRIGRIDRLGQLSKHLTVINLITKGSIEMKIAAGLSLKQNLFDGVLNDDSQMGVVDFSAAGHSQFLQQLEEAMDELLNKDMEEVDTSAKEQLDLDESISELIEEEQPTTVSEQPTKKQGNQQTDVQEMEKAMNSGLEFLSGMMKMATGKDMGLEGRSVEVDQDTGEVTMKFKLPGFGG